MTRFFGFSCQIKLHYTVSTNYTYFNIKPCTLLDLAKSLFGKFVYHLYF